MKGVLNNQEAKAIAGLLLLMPKHAFNEGRNFCKEKRYLEAIRRFYYCMQEYRNPKTIEEMAKRIGLCYVKLNHFGEGRKWFYVAHSNATDINTKTQIADFILFCNKQLEKKTIAVGKTIYQQ
jgi:hypothetical protein